jgi:hypothetical protein
VGSVGIIANPVAGRDVRRVAARGSIVTSEDKRARIARAVVGASRAGAAEVVVMAEPFGVSTGAVADLDVAPTAVRVLDVGAQVSPGDTVRAARAMADAGVDVVMVLGGDGTCRVVAAEWPDAVMVPMSTGTNNVFPTAVEPTVAGAAAGLVASGRVEVEEAADRAKVVRVGRPGVADLALVDAVVLDGDVVGNRMPYDPLRLRTVVLTRAEPTAVGVSATGGWSCPCPAGADHGVLVECGPGGAPLDVPLAPGLFGTVEVRSVAPLPLGEAVTVDAAGALALDGDRLHRLHPGEPWVLVVERTGPRVVDVSRTMHLAAERGLFRALP